MVRSTFILALFTSWSYALEVGDFVIGTREPGNLAVGEIAEVLEIYETWARTTSANIGLNYEGVNWEIYDSGNNSQIGSQFVSRYYLLDGNDYFGGTADYIFKVDYKVSWDVGTNSAGEAYSTYKVQPQGVSVIDYRTQLDPISYSAWLVQYKKNSIVNRYQGEIFYFTKVTYYTSEGSYDQFRVPPPEVSSSYPNLSFSFEVTIIGNYAVVETTPAWNPVMGTPVSGFVDHHLKFNVQENINISL